MSAIEKRARELLAAQYVDEGRMTSAKATMDGHELQEHAEYLVLRAIVAALTPPEGYVLVPVEPTEAMIEAICTEHGSGGWPQGYSRYAQHLRREHAGEGYRAMLAARPEVP